MDSNSYVDLLKVENLNKLDCMSAFQDNWNGVGGVAFSDTAIRTFKNILGGFLNSLKLHQQDGIAYFCNMSRLIIVYWLLK